MDFTGYLQISLIHIVSLSSDRRIETEPEASATSIVRVTGADASDSVSSSDKLASLHLAVVERSHQRRDLVAVILNREVAGVEHMQLGVFHIALKSAAARLGEDRIVRAPH